MSQVRWDLPVLLWCAGCKQTERGYGQHEEGKTLRAWLDAHWMAFCPAYNSFNPDDWFIL